MTSPNVLILEGDHCNTTLLTPGRLFVPAVCLRGRASKYHRSHVDASRWCLHQPTSSTISTHDVVSYPVRGRPDTRLFLSPWFFNGASLCFGVQRPDDEAIGQGVCQWDEPTPQWPTPRLHTLDSQPSRRLFALTHFVILILNDTAPRLATTWLPSTNRVRADDCSPPLNPPLGQMNRPSSPFHPTVS